jgi:hypothetical protein
MGETSSTINGTNGDWNVVIEDNSADKARDRIRINYTPKNPNPCKGLIGLIQTAKLVAFGPKDERLTDPKDIYVDPKSDPDHGKVGLDEEAEKDATGEPVYVDYRKCAQNPFYGVPCKYDPEDLIQKPASMTDGPGGDFGAMKDGIKKVEMTFEVCAFCYATGECLGCITWKMEESRDGQPKEGTVTKISLTSTKENASCSTTFSGALKKFTKKHSASDGEDASKLKWKCPEGEAQDKEDKHIDGFQKATGTSIPPEIPEGFKKKYLETAQADSKTLRFARSEVGGGSLHETPLATIAAAVEHPERAFVKFTWSGFQIGLRPSIVLSSCESLSEGDVAPWMGKGDRFSNDFASTLALTVPPGFLQNLLRALGHAPPETGRPETITIAAGLGTPKAAGWVGTVSPEALRHVLREAASSPNLPPGLSGILRYLFLNHALGEGPFPTRPAPEGRTFQFGDSRVLLTLAEAFRVRDTVSAYIGGTWHAKLEGKGAFRVTHVDAWLDLPFLEWRVPGEEKIHLLSGLTIPLAMGDIPLSEDWCGSFGAVNQGCVDSGARTVSTTLGLMGSLPPLPGVKELQLPLLLRTVGSVQRDGSLSLAGVGAVVAGLLRGTILACAGVRRTLKDEPKTAPVNDDPPKTEEKKDTKPPAAAPPPCKTPIPNTAANVADALKRIGQHTIYKDNRPGIGKQGDWVKIKEFKVNGHAISELKGLTLSFYKVVLDVGCETPTKWKIGLVDLDLQIRIAISKAADNRPAADDGKTPGGVAGTLGHESKHGEASAKELHDALEGTNALTKGLKDKIDALGTTVYPSEADARAALPKVKKAMEEAMQRAIAIGGTHSDATAGPKDSDFPRNNTAEPIPDPDDHPGPNDPVSEDDFKKEITDMMEKEGYKAVVDPKVHGF